MSEPKTKPTKASVTAYVNALTDERKRKEAKALIALMKEATGEKPVLWGESIIGFGSFRYTSDRSGQTGDWLLTGFAMRASGPVIYIMPGFTAYASLLKKLGPHKTGSSCLYLKKLDGIDQKVLATLVARSIKDIRKKYKA